MIEPIADMPAGTVGFRVSGALTADDYQSVLRPALEAAVADEQPLRALYVIQELQVKGNEPAALVEDAKLGFDLLVHHRGQFERSAVVTDIGWMAQAMKLFAWMIPGEVRIFPLADEEAAKTWVAG